MKNFLNPGSIIFCVYLIFFGMSGLSLTACAPNVLKNPCPHYGRFCTKTPVNGWTSENI